MTQQNQGLPPLDSSFADSVFAELVGMDVQLDPDPLPYGPKRLNGKIALTRKFLSRAERIFLDLSQQHARYKRGLRSATLILEVEKKHLLANDPEVRAGRAVSERDAIASGKLQAEVQAVANCQHAVEELETVIAVVKSKRADLKDIQGRLRDQMKICQEELALGSKWGSKSPGRGTELEAGQGFADGSDVEDVDDLIQGVRQISRQELHVEAEVDDTDTTDEVEEDLSVAASVRRSPDNVPAPAIPLVDEDEDDELPAQGAGIIPGAQLVQVLGFLPHCNVCGEPQFRVIGSGMSCVNGHGGADSVEMGDDPFEDEEGVVLEATSTREEIDDFLDSPTMLGSGPPDKKTRREIEDEDASLDIDALLANFTE